MDEPLPERRHCRVRTAEIEAEAGAPDGYVDVGFGTSIPAGGPGECESSTYIWIGATGDEPMHAEMGGADLVDTGPREFAVGDVGLDDHGRPATYAVAPGDVLILDADLVTDWAYPYADERTAPATGGNLDSGCCGG